MDEFEKDHQRRVGERGNPIFEREQQTTDLEEMRERTVETTGTCYCGRPVDADSVRRCVNCDLLCCRSCEVVVRRQIVCRQCAEQVYGLRSKDVFLTLYLVDKDLVTADELVEVFTDEDGTPIEVRIDAAAHQLLANGYIDEDGSVTPLGAEALQVGKQLYGEDGDVQEAIQSARIEEVADR